MTGDIDFFDNAFAALTQHQPFPWQRELYRRFIAGDVPPTASLPTGLGKTNVIAIWLVALKSQPAVMPRRLVYVVNRRTVVDQTTTEAEHFRERAAAAGVDRPEISTLRGQFADNRAWSADPSRPAIIVGTVDMIGSRLLFGGYGVGFKARPLHAGFLGQDALLVHDEAHLEPAFQELLAAIEKEQHEGERTGELPWRKLRVMELSATSRSGGEPFELTPADCDHDMVKKRIGAKKAIHLHENKDEKKLAEQIGDLAVELHNGSGQAVLVFVRKVDDVEKVVKRLAKNSSEQLTGTLRGLERDGLVKRPIFQRFLPLGDRDERVTPAPGTVYLVCTSAGEVGVNLSADHLVSDLSTFDSMAQRFGRVNRFGEPVEHVARIDVVHPLAFDEKHERQGELESRRKKTLALLHELNGNGSPAALAGLKLERRVAAFAPPPKTLPTSDILFDAWALTTIRDRLPGRPMIEPYLHGISGWEPPETHVAWREEVWELRLKFANEDERRERDAEERKHLAKFAIELLGDYPIKPHELLRDNSTRVFDRLKKLKADPGTPAWILADDETVVVTTLGELIEAGKEEIERKTLLLPPSAGGLENGMLNGGSELADDVADKWFEDAEGVVRRRQRTWSDEPKPERKDGMRLVREIDTRPGADEVDTDPADGQGVVKGRYWRWYVRPRSADDDGSKTAVDPIRWQHHTDDVTGNATRLADALLNGHPRLHAALVSAARFHDLGKRREVWQRSIGNPNPRECYAKSGKGWKPRELSDYRHEFGSLIDIEREAEFQSLDAEAKDLVLHLIAVHHGYGRPHFPPDHAFDTAASADVAATVAAEVPRRFARLQRRYGRWGLAYLESLLRAADWAASASPSKEESS